MEITARIEDTICHIKPEYLVPIDRSKKELPKEESEPCNINNKNEVEMDDKPDNAESLEPAAKKQKVDKKQKKRGKNTNRPIYKENITEKLCRSVMVSKDCSWPSCKMLHDVQEYLKNKAKDISDTCYIYSTKGFCKYGVTCRFAGVHLDDLNQNMGTDSQLNGQEGESNTKKNDLYFTLKRRKFDFSKSDEVVNSVGKLVQSNKTKELDGDRDSNLGPCSDEDAIKVTPREVKKINFKDKLYLAPLTTVGNLPYRRICKEYGADVTCGEMACAVPLINGHKGEWALTRRHESEDLFGIQICGHSSKLVTYACQVLAEEADFDFIDLNLGCPIDLIYQQGAGSALLRRSNVLESIVRSCSTLLAKYDKTFTIKTRTGVYADRNVAHEFIPKFAEWGAKLVTLHGRSREQRYTKLASWHYIEECAKTVETIPVFGNGDIMSFEDYNATRERAKHISGIMIARGALIKPWIFQEIKEQRTLDPSSKERFEMLKKYVNYGLEHWGSDTIGVENTRRFLLEWQSFLYRYVPYGLLERPPQRINQRPDQYIGRDDLETLMASPNYQDWIKLSEMLLGSVPVGFQFLPKHKANSY